MRFVKLVMALVLVGLMVHGIQVNYRSYRAMQVACERFASQQCELGQPMGPGLTPELVPVPVPVPVPEHYALPVAASAQAKPAEQADLASAPSSGVEMAPAVVREIVDIRRSLGGSAVASVLGENDDVAAEFRRALLQVHLADGETKPRETRVVDESGLNGQGDRPVRRAP